MRLTELLDKTKKVTNYDSFCILVEDNDGFHIRMLEKGTAELTKVMAAEIGDLTPTVMTGYELYCNYAGLIPSEIIKKNYTNDEAVLVITLSASTLNSHHGYKYIDGVWRDQLPIGRCHCNSHKGCLNVALMKKHGCLAKKGYKKCSFFQKYEGHAYWKMRATQNEQKKGKREWLRNGNAIEKNK